MKLYDMQVSLGGLSPESNEEYSKSFFSYLEEKIGVTDDRGYMWVFAGCLPHWLNNSFAPAVCSKIPEGLTWG
jgi:hypothetical protein